MRLVVEKQCSWTIRLTDGSIELSERPGKNFSRLRRLRLVGGLDADLADHDTPRPEETQPTLDGLANSSQRVASTNERVAVCPHRFNEPVLVTVTVAKLPFETDPSRGFATTGELAEKDGLAGAADSSQRPVRVGRVRLAQEALELGEQRVTPREVRRGDAVPWTKRVRELFSSGSWLGLRHVVYPLASDIGPRDADGRRLGRVVHLKSTLRYCALAGTRNQERLRAAFWMASR
jgi:hypothetical protein